MAAPKIRALEELKAQIQELGTSRSIKLRMDSDSADKLKWLKDADRDFARVTPEMKAAITRAVQSAVKRGGLKEMYPAIKPALRDHISGRFEGSIRDVPLRRLSPGWIKYKATHGGDPRIGIFRRDLLRAIQSARIEFV